MLPTFYFKFPAVGAVVLESVRLVVVNGKIIPFVYRNGGVVEIVDGSALGDVCNFKKIVAVKGVVIHV